MTTKKRPGSPLRRRSWQEFNSVNNVPQYAPRFCRHRLQNLAGLSSSTSKIQPLPFHREKGYTLTPRKRLRRLVQQSSHIRNIRTTSSSTGGLCVPDIWYKQAHLTPLRPEGRNDDNHSLLGERQPARNVEGQQVPRRGPWRASPASGARTWPCGPLGQRGGRMPSLRWGAEARLRERPPGARRYRQARRRADVGRRNPS